jgi:hypothetical protein
MPVIGLISKLCITGVVEREIHELRFTDRFCAYLSQYNQRHLRSKAGTVQGWREIMTGFDGRLEALSDGDICMTIALLDYFLQKLSAR